MARAEQSGADGGMECGDGRGRNCCSACLTRWGEGLGRIFLGDVIATTCPYRGACGALSQAPAAPHSTQLSRQSQIAKTGENCLFLAKKKKRQFLLVLAICDCRDS